MDINFIPIQEIEVGSVYFTQTHKYPIEIVGKSRYGFNCTLPMVTYRMLCATKDAERGQLFTLEEEFVLKKYFAAEQDFKASDFTSFVTFYNHYGPAVVDFDRKFHRLVEEYGYDIERLCAGKDPVDYPLAEYKAELTSTPIGCWTSQEGKLV